MVIDRPEKHGFPQVRRRLLTQGARETARGKAVIAALPGRARRMPAVLGFLRQVEEREEQLLRALQKVEREAVAGDDQEPGAFAGLCDLSGNRAPGGGTPEKRADVDGRNDARCTP
jgi:hypothetical protein